MRREINQCRCESELSLLSPPAQRLLIDAADPQDDSRLQISSIELGERNLCVSYLALCVKVFERLLMEGLEPDKFS